MHSQRWEAFTPLFALHIWRTESLHFQFLNEKLHSFSCPESQRSILDFSSGCSCKLPGALHLITNSTVISRPDEFSGINDSFREYSFTSYPSNAFSPSSSLPRSIKSNLITYSELTDSKLTQQEISHLVHFTSTWVHTTQLHLIIIDTVRVEWMLGKHFITELHPQA